MGKTKKNRTRKLKQKMYRMKGCSKKGGTNLAYTGGKETVPRPVLNPHLAFTGNTNFGAGYKGGGCSSCSNPLRMNGGGCSSCSNPLMNGGGGCGCGLNIFKGGNGSFVGKPWTSNPSTWPSQNTGNDYPLNTLKVDPQTSIKNGGRKRRRRSTRRSTRMTRKGGGVMQDISNLGRQFQYGATTFFNGLNGYSPPVNPLPWKGQLPNTHINISR
jgi:hypothetical protein